MSNDSPAVILYNNLGNPIGTIIDGVFYRLQVEAKLAPNSIIGIDGYATGGLALENTLSTLNNKINTLGQKSMATSTPVVLASNQSAIPVTVVDALASAQNKVAYDIGATVIYIGTAELGSLTSAAVWLIKRITLVAGVPTFTQWSDSTSIWNNRAIVIYT